MRDTVFVPSFGNRPRVLVGRSEILADFEESIQSFPGSRERALLILGQRGYGKTVLLLEFAEIAKRKGFIVTSPTVVSKDMPSRVLEKLSTEGERYISKVRPQITGGSISILGSGAGIDLKGAEQPRKSFAWELSSMCGDLNRSGKPVLILIDEVQANHDSLRQLIVSYQEMVGEGRDVAIVFAGLPSAISSVLNDHVLTFLNRAAKIVLPKLRLGDVELYYRRAFSGLGIYLSDEAIGAAAEKTQGSPYLMQLIGHYLVMAADEEGRVENSLYTAAMERAREDFISDICQTTIAALSEKDVNFLGAMAQDEEFSEMSAIVSRLNWTDSAAQTYKRRLIQAGVIEQKRRGAVQFAVPYLRDYLRRQTNV